jgi:hypothetical protein
MATIPTSFTRFQTSLPTARTSSGFLVTTVTPRRPPGRQPGARIGNLFNMPQEPEDARLTGGTRSLERRLLALNVAGSLPKPAVGTQASALKVRSTALLTAPPNAA